MCFEAFRHYVRQEKERFHYRYLRWRNNRVNKRWAKRQNKYLKKVYRDTTYSVTSQDSSCDFDPIGFGKQKSEALGQYVMAVEYLGNSRKKFVNRKSSCDDSCSEDNFGIRAEKKKTTYPVYHILKKAP